MAIVLVQSASSTTTTGNTTMAATFASPITAGNWLGAVAVVFGGSGTPSFTQVADSKGNGVSGKYVLPASGSIISTPNATGCAIYYAENVVAAAAGADTVTLTGTNISAFCLFTVCEFSGIATSGSIDVANGASQNDGGASTTPTVNLVTTTANDLFIGGCIGDNGQTVAGTVGGVAATLLSNGGGNGDITQYLISALAAGTRAFASGNADDGWTIIGAAFKPAGAAPAIPTQYPFGIWLQ